MHYHDHDRNEQNRAGVSPHVGRLAPKQSKEAGIYPRVFFSSTRSTASRRTCFAFVFPFSLISRHLGPVGNPQLLYTATTATVNHWTRFFFFFPLFFSFFFFPCSFSFFGEKGGDDESMTMRYMAFLGVWSGLHCTGIGWSYIYIYIYLFIPSFIFVFFLSLLAGPVVVF